MIVHTWRSTGAPIREDSVDGCGRQVVEQPFAREHRRAGGVEAVSRQRVR